MSVKRDVKRGTWEVKFSYRNYAGEKKWVHKRGFEKKSDAQKWETEYRAKIEGSNDMLLCDFIEVYKSYIKTRIRESTFENKMSIIERWIIPYLGNKPINQITTKDIIEWQNIIMKSVHDKSKEGLKKSYQKSIHTHLSAIFNHACKFYDLKNNPCQIVGNMGHQNDVEINFWTLEEYKKVRKVMMDNPMYYYLFEILYWCGLRIGELLALQISDIDFENKTISITKGLTVVKGKRIIGDPKTKKSKRTIGIPDFLAEELNDYLAMTYELKEDQRLFDLNKSSINRFLKRAAKKAGVKEISIHGLRHSHVSLLIDMGYTATAIADRVGHESVGMTMRYSHLFPSTATNMVNELEKINEEIEKDIYDDEEKRE